MRLNEDIAISTPKILLVPYDAHHVGQYHKWMQDEALREATASDLLTLDEEYENQLSWRAAHDKLTFIVCQPVSGTATTTETGIENADVPSAALTIRAGEDDAPPRMVGDVNLFLTPCDDDDEENDESNGQNDLLDLELQGEIDIMIAAPGNRGKGLGEAAVRAFLRFLAGHLNAIVGDYVRGASPSLGDARLKRLVAKINADNAGSIRLFGNLGFHRIGDPNYFNEISMVLLDFPPTAELGADLVEYRECPYDRSRRKMKKHDN
ncbi:acetyltransferase domain-containing protein [Nemania sp. FL0031]|nr:acetyltransferase domain-containing protein [Nemania sp. FL0031]